MKKRYPLHAAVAVTLATIGAAAGGGPSGYEIARWTIDGGGASASTGDGYELNSTIGQPDAAILSGGGYELSGGFWHAVSPGDCVEDGSVNLFDYAAFEECLAGPGVPLRPECACFDLDGNGSVDLIDFGIIQAYFNGS